MLSGLWTRFLAVFAFVFLTAIGGLAVDARFPAALALAVATPVALALGVFFLLLTLLLFTPVGVLVHRVCAFFVIIKCRLESRELSADLANQVCLFFAGQEIRLPLKAESIGHGRPGHSEGARYYSLN
jgi:hypothetical protein